MADGSRPHKRLTLREFLEWEERQPLKYELIDGLVVMMAGGTNAHNTLATNILTALKVALRGKTCRPCNNDTKVFVADGQSYYPDVTVDCGPFHPDRTHAAEPTIVFEVLSDSTEKNDMTLKLAAYQATPTIRQIVYVVPSRMHVMIWTRGPDGWVEDERVHPETAVPLPALGLDLPLADIYEGLHARG